MKTLGWLWWGLMMLLSTLYFWVPPVLIAQAISHLWDGRFDRMAFCPPIGLTLVLLLCLMRAWTPADRLSIKPLANRRTMIDRWRLFDSVFGNREDGASGRYAYGQSWTGPYNATGSIWGAFCWNCRNWMANFNYATWPGNPANAPNYQTPYKVPAWFPIIGGTMRTPRLGWQQLPRSDGWFGGPGVRMVCSL